MFPYGSYGEEEVKRSLYFLISGILIKMKTVWLVKKNSTMCCYGWLAPRPAVFTVVRERYVFHTRYPILFVERK